MHILTTNSQKMQLCVFLFTNFNCLLALSKVYTNHVIIRHAEPRLMQHSLPKGSVMTQTRADIQTSELSQTHDFRVNYMLHSDSFVKAHSKIDKQENTSKITLLWKRFFYSSIQKVHFHTFYIYLHQIFHIKWNVSLWNDF